MDEQQIQAWKEADEHGIDNEDQLVQLIRWSLLTPEQDKWLKDHGKSIEVLLNGRDAINIEN